MAKHLKFIFFSFFAFQSNQVNNATALSKLQLDQYESFIEKFFMSDECNQPPIASSVNLKNYEISFNQLSLVSYWLLTKGEGLNMSSDNKLESLFALLNFEDLSIKLQIISTNILMYIVLFFR